MSPFWTVFAQAGGVLAALLLAWFVVVVISNAATWAKWRGDVAEYRLREQEKTPPYTKVELIECPNERMVGIDFYGNDGKLAWHGSADLPPWLYRAARPKTRWDVPA